MLGDVITLALTHQLRNNLRPVGGRAYFRVDGAALQRRRKLLDSRGKGRLYLPLRAVCGRPPARPEEQLGDGRSLDVCGLLKDGKHADGVRQEFKENAEEEEKSAAQHAGCVVHGCTDDQAVAWPQSAHIWCTPMRVNPHGPE
ncbi:hypothetical protein D4764_15G0013140 [Takifugu flavidus]|uniref:Uncharacterized protein n=1 Tax=Takifugu flavidus TaxID=433684 RepID=A0A5C6P4W4_9TELE|nr:hypothetical protein D4764_15G0013140 [Takifugu flavidus]